MNKIKQIVKEFERLNKTKDIKINGTDRKRLIFINSDEVFKIFSNCNDERGLNPFNDYSYNWLNEFLCDFLDSINEEDNINDIMRDFEDNINEKIDGTTDIYTSNLTAWLNHNNSNVYYLTEALEEQEIKDGFNLLQIAQYKAIEESYYSFLSSLKTYLNNKYELEL